VVTLEGNAFWSLRRGVVHAQHGVVGSCHCFLLIGREGRQKERLEERAFGNIVVASVINTRLKELLGGLKGKGVVLTDEGGIGRSCGLELQGTKDCNLLCERVNLLSQPGHHRAKVGLGEGSIVHRVFNRNGC